MALTKHTLGLISIFAILFLAQCSKVTSSRTPTPSSDEDSSSSEDEDSSSETLSPTPNPTPLLSSEGPTPLFSSDGPTPPLSSDESSADSPMSISELMELSLPEIGLQKASVGPQTEGAKVANKQLEGMEHKIDEFKATLTKRAECPLLSESVKKCFAQCQDNLEEAMDGVKISIESINNQDFQKANVDISGIATDIETCNDCFIELDGEDKDINAFNEWIKGVTKECLNNLKQT